MILGITATGLSILITAIATLLGVVVNLVLGLHNKNRIVEVKQITNGRTDRMQKRIEDLIQIMTAAGIPVPESLADDWNGQERRNGEDEDVPVSKQA